MEKNTYVPGDLVMTNGVPLGTKKGVVYRVTASDPNKTLELDDGTVLKGTVCLENIKGAELGDEGYLMGDCCAWVKDIVPIVLSVDVLEKNGWEKSIGWSVYGAAGYKETGYKFTKELEDDGYGRLQICQCHNLRDWCYTNECANYFEYEFTYVHQLQHILVAFEINNEMEV